MGRRPSFLHGREVGPTVFGGAAGPLQQFDIWVPSERRLGWRSEQGVEEQDAEKGRQMERGTRDRVRQSDKGEEDKRCLTGRLSVAEGIGDSE